MKFYCKHKRLCRVIPYFVIGLCVSVITGSSGQFMNSLAVLFRSKSPWPTTFPVSNGNSGTIQVFQNSMPKSPSGQKPAPMLSSAASQQGILVAHPIQSKPHPKNFRKPPPHRHNFGPPSLFSNQHRPQFFPNNNHPPPRNQMNSGPPNQMSSGSSIQINSNPSSLLGSSSTMTGSFRYPDVPSPPQFENMVGGDLPHRYQNWHSSQELQSSGLSSSKSSDFRPSPQLLDSFSSGFTKSHEIVDGKFSSQFQAGEAKRLPRYESGFQPISFNQYGFNVGSSPIQTTTTTATVPNHYINPNSDQNFYNSWSVPLNPPYDSYTFSESTTITPLIKDGKQMVNAEVSKSVVSTDFSVEEAKSSEPSDLDFESKITSSSERVEDWITSQAKTSKLINSGEKFKFPVYKKRVRPIKCEKFHRYGFCPVTSNYPSTQVEKITSRCSALMSHLIAPLLKTDVHYDIVVTRNGNFRGRSAVTAGRSGSRTWSWKDYRGKPICDTEEIKIVPGWAKNGDGDWLVILQTQLWKQEAQISICSPPGSNNKCHGASCEKGLNGNFKDTKCVQRFTAQRMAVLDPESQDRCPVVRSVFLPSACVCLSDSDNPTVEGNTFQSVSGESLELEDSHISGSEQVPVVLPSTSTINNGTYMIVSEKYSTKESSAESHESS